MAEKDLLFLDWQNRIQGDLGKTEWVTVFSRSSAHPDVDRGGFHSALVSGQIIKDVLNDYQWDMRRDGGFPSSHAYYENGKEIIEYHRRSESGIEPFVYWRNFHDIKEEYYEVSEEFRLFFNLYEDKKNSTFFYIDDNGDEEDVITITEDRINIRLKYIKEFLSVKKMYLALYFDLMRFSEKTLEESGTESIEDVKRADAYIYSIFTRNMAFKDNKSQGWLLGKKLIPGLKNYRPNIFGRSVEDKYEEFIIGVDEEGKDIFYTCDKEKLANLFGQNPASPQYLTPVFFRKEVLNKYYDNPQKYSVEDGYIHCKSLWGLTIDNNHPQYVMVFLGDLCMLPHKEQIYWRSFNLSHEGGISRVAWKRAIEGEFADPEQPDLYFKFRFQQFQENWFERFGWYLFKPLSAEDSHHYNSLHIPTRHERKEFDEQVLSVTKIIIDSLNERELTKNLTLKKDGAKGIDKLEYFLSAKNISFKGMIEFLRNLQALRSTSVAHRKSEKSKDYQKVRKFFDFDNKEFPEIFADILIKAIWTLNSLERYFLTGHPAD